MGWNPAPPPASSVAGEELSFLVLGLFSSSEMGVKKPLLRGFELV